MSWLSQRWRDRLDTRAFRLLAMARRRRPGDFAPVDRGGAPRAQAWAALAVGLAVAGVAVACDVQGEIPPLEIRAQQLNSVIMCPVCPGESIDQSQNPLALQMRGIVLERLQQGWTAEQIKESFVDSYGPSVLLEPPREGLSLAVWVLPPVAVMAALLALYVVLRLMRRTPAGQPVGTDAGIRPSDPELADYVRRIEAAIDYGGGRVAQSEHQATTGQEARGMTDG